MKIRIPVLWTWVVLIHSAAFLVFWLTNTTFYIETNNFLTKMIGIKLDYISYCLMFSSMLVGWSLVRVLLRWRSPKPASWWVKLGDWLYAILGVIYMFFFYGSFYMLFHESPGQKIRLIQLLAYFRVILDPLLLLGVAVLAASWIHGKALGWKRAAPILIVLVILWSLVLAFPPSSVIRGKLPEKPLLVAHRGADALEPENTLAAARAAAESGVYGQEMDVQMSADGQLFLMHDDTLSRTTNVEIVYPQRIKDKAGTFTWEELSRLDAGSWFSQDDPFGTIRKDKVNSEQVEQFTGEPIPTFREWLGVLKTSGQVFLYDVKSTGDDPAGQSAVFEATLRQIAEADLAEQSWILAGSDQTTLVRDILPEAKLAYGVDDKSIPTAVKLHIGGYQVVNAEYILPVKSFLDFQKEGYWVNIYTVDEAWQYSRLWILGVNSTTTDNLTGLMALKNPAFSVPYVIYALLLVVVGVIAIGINRLLERSLVHPPGGTTFRESLGGTPQAMRAGVFHSINIKNIRIFRS
ncbi:MAG: glycerophosphodiester phosphodiesterase family protein [Anaerolineaceae bacterium]